MITDARALAELDSLPILHFHDADLPGAAGLPQNIRWQEFHTVRSAVLDVLRPFGSVGPMGPATITDELEGPPNPWPIECDEPDLFVVDDMWNYWDRRIEVELKRAGALTTPMLHALRAVLAKKHPQWSVGLSTTGGYVLVGTKRILVKGGVYRRCRTVGDVVRAAQRACGGPSPDR